MPVDVILFCDTGLEFPQMYEHLDKVEQYTGRAITRLFLHVEVLPDIDCMEGRKGGRTA